MRNKLCPKCDADVTHSYVGYDPDVGVFAGGWYCETCQLAIKEEPYDESDREIRT